MADSETQLADRQENTQRKSLFQSKHYIETHKKSTTIFKKINQNLRLFRNKQLNNTIKSDANNLVQRKN